MIKYIINNFDIVSIYPRIISDSGNYILTIKDGKISFDLRKYPKIMILKEV